MSKAEHQLDTSGVITDLLFNDNHHEKRSWRFYNSRIPLSEVVYFNFSQNSFSGKTFWFSLLSCTVGYALPNPKL